VLLDGVYSGNRSRFPTRLTLKRCWTTLAAAFPLTKCAAERPALIRFRCTPRKGEPKFICGRQATVVDTHAPQCDFPPNLRALPAAALWEQLTSPVSV